MSAAGVIVYIVMFDGAAAGSSSSRRQRLHANHAERAHHVLVVLADRDIFAHREFMIAER